VVAVSFHTGDIVMECPEGFRILGRERDLYFRPDGSLVTASDVDAVLPSDFACWHYALSQTGDMRWDFQYVADHTADHKSLERAVAGLLGPGVRVNAFRRKAIAPAASGKFALLKPLARG
jgi:phenylacetate-CoA ligase